jgi:pseudaminic acid cytidylyltransferase
MNAAVIAARGGSTRIPRKNVRPFAGKPMIAHSIAAARAAGVFDRVLVSTDCAEIAGIAKDAGAETPFVRPAELARNEVNLADVLRHALLWLREHGDPPTYACLITATAPFLRPEALREGARRIAENDVDAVTAVTRFPSPAFRALTTDEGGRLRFVWPEYELAHSNDLPETYHDAGQFDWVNVERFLSSGTINGGEVLPVEIPPYLAWDIDTEDDWRTAEILYDLCRRRGWL